MTNVMGNYMVCFDGNFLWAAKNGSWMAFKVSKEGVLEIRSKLLSDASTVVVNIRFKEKTFVKSMIHWRLANRKLTPEMPVPPAAEEAREIAGVRYF